MKTAAGRESRGGTARATLLTGLALLALLAAGRPTPAGPDPQSASGDAVAGAGDDEDAGAADTSDADPESMDDDVEAMDDADAMDDEPVDDDEGLLRFIPRGFVRPVGGWGAFPDAPEDGAEAAADRADPALELRARLATLREASARLRTEWQAAQAEYDALVEPSLGADHWAGVILDHVGALEEADAARAARATAALCMRSIAAAGTVRVKEGVARSVRGAALEELVARGEVRSRDGFWYHTEPTACDALRAARLTALVVDPASLAGPGGGKFCGGFHPDLRLDYGPVQVLVCFGCRDIRYETRSESVTFDLSPEALAKFEAIGRTIFRHRAEPDAAE